MMTREEIRSLLDRAAAMHNLAETHWLRQLAADTVALCQQSLGETGREDVEFKNPEPDEKEGE